MRPDLGELTFPDGAGRWAGTLHIAPGVLREHSAWRRDRSVVAVMVEGRVAPHEAAESRLEDTLELGRVAVWPTGLEPGLLIEPG